MTRINKTFIAAALMVGAVLAFSNASARISAVFPQQQVPQKKVKRVKRPQFTDRDSSGIYFGNVFEDAIQGERPSAIAGTGKPLTPTIGENSGNESASGDFVWSDYISGEVLETEIKRLEKLLAKQVTSPGKFKTEFKDARYSFQMLSMLFGIIVEHNEDVRWKRVANLAQPSYALAAKNARRGDGDSYNYAVARRDDLTELIRGGNMSSTEKPAESIVWRDTIARTPLMKRLQDSVDKVKPMLSNKTEFESNREEILHEANLMAAMSEVLAKESMDEAEEEDYLVYTRTMSSAARLMMTNTVSDNYDAVSEGFNQINQACSNCHDEWR